MLENDAPKMIAPIMIVPVGGQYKSVGLSRGAYFIGRQGYSDYLNFIYKDFSEEACKEVFTYLRTQLKLKKCCFEQLFGTTKLYNFISSKYNCSQSECYCAALILPETFDDYKKKLSKSTR